MKGKKQVLVCLCGCVALGLAAGLGFWAGSSARVPEEQQEKTETGFTLGSKRAALGLCGADGTYGVLSTDTLPPAVTVRMEDELPLEEAAYCYLRKGTVSVYVGTEGLSQGSVWGIDERFFSDAGFFIRQGTGITQKDVQEENRVAVLDQRAAQMLFSGEDAVGQIVEVEQIPLQVVGIADFEENSHAGGMVFVPETLWPELYQFEEPQAAVVWAETEETLKETSQRTLRMLNSLLPQETDYQYGIIQ